MRAKAFCPGHITGFFEIVRTDSPLTTGSRGAGMCISLGATSEVEVEKSDLTEVHIEIDGREAEAEVTRMSLEGLLRNRRFRVDVSTAHDLPISQGFGMSGAGALAATTALASVLGEGRQRVFEAVHTAEVLCSSGLGDVAAIHRGGITVRDRAGLPPAGSVRGIEGEPDVLLAVIDEPLKTGKVLSDADLTSRINEQGNACLDKLLRGPSLEELMSLSRRFALRTGLATPRIRGAIEDALDAGEASMVMLGNSVFAVGDDDRLEDILRGHGTVYRCKVDMGSARLVAT